jgi:RNA polymerase sigma-70 factor (ECF subfamily)
MLAVNLFHLPYCRSSTIKIDSADLFQQIASGNEHAFTDLYYRYSPIIQKYFRVLGYQETLFQDDIAQEIFLTLWQRRKKIAEIVSFEKYLFTMVRNGLFDETIRARTRQRAWKQLGNLSPDQARTTEEDTDYRETYRIYLRSLQTLPPRSRLAHRLKEQQGLKIQGIAKAMGISKSSTKIHLNKATKKIRAYMDAQGCY